MTNMTSSISLRSDECHKETAIMSSHSYGSKVIVKSKALQLILPYSSQSSLKGRLVITEAHRIYCCAYFRWRLSRILSPMGKRVQDELTVMIHVYTSESR